MKQIFILVILCSLISCNQEIRLHSIFSYDYTSYVYSYHIVDSMYLEKISSNNFKIYFRQSAVPINRESNKVEYDSLGMKHEDMNYNKSIVRSTPNFPHNYLAFDLLSIILTSNSDFDEQHLAGSPLNDIVQYTAYSPYPFIKSNYSLPNEITKIDKCLEECTLNDFILTLGQEENLTAIHIPCCCLTIKQAPTLSKLHTITVTILDDAGNTWEASIDMDWSK